MKRILSTALGLALVASTSAFAYDGYVTGSVSLRAGPDSGYPSVARLSAGTSVVIEGCVDDWSWCDVSNHDDRGWVSANYLQNEYQGHRVLVPQYGVQIGIPIVAFVFGSYWDDHYRSRSWYHDRDRYSRVTPHYAHAGTSGGSHAYQAPAGQPRASATATSQPSYQAKSSATTTQRTATTQVRTPETTPTRPPVEHNMPAADQQHAAQQQGQQQQAQQQKAQHQQQAQQPQQEQQQQKTTTTSAPKQQARAQAKSPPAQGAAKDKGNQGGGKDQNKDQGGGKDQNKDQGGGKDKGNDGGGK